MKTNDRKRTYTIELEGDQCLQVLVNGEPVTLTPDTDPEDDQHLMDAYCSLIEGETVSVTTDKGNDRLYTMQGLRLQELLEAKGYELRDAVFTSDILAVERGDELILYPAGGGLMGTIGAYYDEN